ncbi:hypothetical protein ACHAWX_006357 [Stephanocyclus meneghinianus]
MSEKDPESLFILSLDSPHSTLVTTGGKGHNLSVLSQNGSFPVPNGFCVTVAAYRDFVASGGLREEIEGDLSLLNGKGDDDVEGGDKDINVEEISSQIRSAFQKRTLSQSLQSQIATALLNHFPNNNENNNTFLAVRSSATCEDMPDASFAGQHDTYLNVSPDPDNVCRHIIDCFSSLFTPRAIIYRKTNSINHLDAGMAVVVQAMVQSRCSGVLFTANPVNGRRNETVLEVIPGLGEALVSGLTEPDRYIVKRGEEIRIKDQRIGKKAKAIQSVEGGGVQEVVDTTGEGTPVLTEDQVKDLVVLGQQVSALFENTPQDIEFAISKEGITYLVQSRPITTLFPLPNVPPEPLQVFISFNAVQGISAPIFPAGQDALNGPNGLLGGLLRYLSWGRWGNGPLFQRVAGRLYANTTGIIRNSFGRSIYMKFMPLAEPGILAGLEEEIHEPGLEIADGLNLKLILRLMSIGIVVLPRYILNMMFPDRARKRIYTFFDEVVANVEKEAENVTGLAGVIEFKQKTLTGLFPKVLMNFLPCAAPAMHSMLLLMRLSEKLPDAKDQVLTITRGLPHNVTTEMDLKLWKVAKAIQSDDTSHNHFRSVEATMLAKEYLTKRLPGKAQTAIEEFMHEYGMRGLYEIDFGRPRWREEPTPLMQTLKTYIDIDEGNAPDEIFAAGEVAAEMSIRNLGMNLGKPWLISFLARRVRALAGVRELPKFTIIRVMGIIRAKLLDEGEKLANMGLIGEATDLFLLYDDELNALAKGDLKNCKALIAQRKEEMTKENSRKRIPRVIASDGFAFFGGVVRKANVKDGDLCGEPVSPGVYEGRIRVVHDPSKTKLSPGEILCCHGTDPSWTPLFLSAGALVMEVGGAMTHGSVVAREYGIPAIVGLECVTEKLTTGQLVRVDGSSGIVEVLEDAEIKQDGNGVYV